MKRKLLLTIATLLSVTSVFSQRPSIGGYTVYYGSLHNHSVICGHAPNAGRPINVYNYAKNTAKLDFFSMAEHDSYSDPSGYYPITQTLWNEIKAAANSTNEDGVFTALWGFEWSSTDGHVGVIGTEDYTTTWTWYNSIPLPNISYTCPTFTDLSNWLSSRNGVAFFHHPGRARVNEGSTNEFGLFKVAHTSKFVGMELWNKNDDWYRQGGVTLSDSYGPYEEALSNWWKVGAVGGFDDHIGTPGSPSYLYSFAILANNLTRTDIMEALKARRFFSTYGKKIALSFKINGNEMGSIIPGGSSTARILATNGDGRVFTKVELLTKGGVLVNSWNVNTANVDISYTLTTDQNSYYYVRLTQNNDAGKWTVSSPIFTDRTPLFITTHSVLGSSSDDAEENGNFISLTSSDLEMPIEYNTQTIGIRFTGLNIPKGATINSATIQFTSKAANSEATNLNIYCHAHDNSPAFASLDKNVTNRALTTVNVSWLPAAWSAANLATDAQKTPELKTIVQQIVNRSLFTSSSAISFIIKGTGKRVAYSYDGSSASAPLLNISYTPVGSTVTVTKTIRVNTSMDDVEENYAGWVYTNSSDLELLQDDLKQYIGLRFTGLEIPKGASIRQAYIQFTTDEPSSVSTTITIRGEASDNPATFTTTPGNISGRPRTTAYATWNPGAWNVVDEASYAQQSPNLISVIQEIVKRPGYTSSSAISLILYGNVGKRVARAYDYSPSKAPKLVVSYAGSYIYASPLVKSAEISSDIPVSNSDINVYPTNFTNSLIVTSNGDSPAQYKLVNIYTGQTVLKGTTKSSAETINSSAVQPGFYVMSVIINNVTRNFKVTKQ